MKIEGLKRICANDGLDWCIAVYVKDNEIHLVSTHDSGLVLDLAEAFAVAITGISGADPPNLHEDDPRHGTTH